MKTITTAGISAERRGRFWREAISDTFVELDCKIERDARFSGSLRQSCIGPLSYTLVESDKQHVNRLAKRRAGDNEYILVSIETTGHGILRQDCREVRLEVGSFAIYDTVRPYELHFDGCFSQTVVQIPRALIKERLGMTEHVTAVPLSANDPLVQLTRDYLLALGRFDGSEDALTVERITQQAVDLLALTLQSNLQLDLTASIPRATQLYRAKQFIELHLGESNFNLASLGARMALSTRYINELFSDEHTSFGRYLLMRRLHHCAADMRNPCMRNRTINELAFSRGFNNMSHFSATFRKRYGMSPREYRCSIAIR